MLKEPTEEAFLSKDGFLGDDVADLKHHGGPDRAVCVYSYEHYALWEEEFQTTLPASTFGENITVTNMLERDVCIGDTYQLGEAIIQVTQARVPCSTISKRLGIPGILPRIVATGYTGYLCRVLQEGTVRQDSKITLSKSVHQTMYLFCSLTKFIFIIGKIKMALRRFLLFQN